MISERNLYESISSEEKERIWKEKAAEIDQLADKLGLGIDEVIKDTVIAFQVLGINTVSSHEGKIDRYPVPYIDVMAEEVDSLDKKLDSLSPDQGAEAQIIVDEIKKEI